MMIKIYCSQRFADVRFRFLGLVVTLFLSMGQLQAGGADQPWIKVDTQQQTLMVMKGEQVLQVFGDISVGHGGAADLHFQGDGRTPKGVFQIGWINPNSKFHLFFGLDYPSMDHARRAYELAQIDFKTYQQISQSLARGRMPPQDTALGGYIGIHGLGNKSPRMHKRVNWTEGCVALTNEQIDWLASWVDIGTRVVIF